MRAGGLVRRTLSVLAAFFLLSLGVARWALQVCAAVVYLCLAAPFRWLTLRREHVESITKLATLTGMIVAGAVSAYEYNAYKQTALKREREKQDFEASVRFEPHSSPKARVLHETTKQGDLIVQLDPELVVVGRGYHRQQVNAVLTAVSVGTVRAATASPGVYQDTGRNATDWYAWRQPHFASLVVSWGVADAEQDKIRLEASQMVPQVSFPKRLPGAFLGAVIGEQTYHYTRPLILVVPKDTASTVVQIQNAIWVADDPERFISYGEVYPLEALMAPKDEGR